MGGASITLPLAERESLPTPDPAFGAACQTRPTVRRLGDDPLDVGDELGHFVLTDILGEGGMGTVYRARHKLLDRDVAIKVLLPEFARNLSVDADAVLDPFN